MSLVVEGPSSVTWKGVHVPREVEGCTQSPVFRMGNEQWKLSCGASFGSIGLCIHLPLGSPHPVPLSSVSVRVEGGDGERAGPEELCEEKKDVRVGQWLRIWDRDTRDVERLLPGFRSDRRLTFRVAIGRERDADRPRTGSNSAGATSAAAQPSPSPCPRPRTFSSASVQTCLSGQNSRTTADASVQTSHSTVPCACLDSLSEDLSRMLEADSSSPDVELRCDGHSTGAHKNVLCSRSEVLSRMLKSDMKEGRTGVVDIKDMDADTFRQFLRHLYTGRVDEETLTFESALCLYEAGDMFAVHSLKRHCYDFLVAHLTIDNACDALVVADTHSDSELVEVVISFILEKDIPKTSDRWSAFCKRHPILALEVANRIIMR